MICFFKEKLLYLSGEFFGLYKEVMNVFFKFRRVIFWFVKFIYKLCDLYDYWYLKLDLKKEKGILNNIKWKDESKFGRF